MDFMLSTDKSSHWRVTAEKGMENLMGYTRPPETFTPWTNSECIAKSLWNATTQSRGQGAKLDYLPDVWYQWKVVPFENTIWKTLTDLQESEKMPKTYPSCSHRQICHFYLETEQIRVIGATGRPCWSTSNLLHLVLLQRPGTQVYTVKF